MIANHQGIGMTSQRTRDRLISRLKEQGIKDGRVLEVMREVPRHLFVDEALASRAYEDTALPIGHGQTISQPHSVAKMTEALLKGGDLEKVLEVGTGSGYQTAVLSRLVKRVFSVERISALQNLARERFYTFKFNNIRLKHSDGNWGWEDNAPYDGIIVTCAPEKVPDSLLMQLSADGGRLVIPVGESRSQSLRIIERNGNTFEETELEPVSFVPLLSGKS